MQRDYTGTEGKNIVLISLIQGGKSPHMGDLQTENPGLMRVLGVSTHYQRDRFVFEIKRKVGTEVTPEQISLNTVEITNTQLQLYKNLKISYLKG